MMTSYFFEKDGPCVLRTLDALEGHAKETPRTAYSFHNTNIGILGDHIPT